MKKIYKFKLDESGTFMPADALIKKFGFQNENGIYNELFIWAEIETNNTVNQFRYFKVIGTGQEIPDKATYHETVFEKEYVWHIYEVFL